MPRQRGAWTRPLVTDPSADTARPPGEDPLPRAWPAAIVWPLSSGALVLIGWLGQARPWALAVLALAGCGLAAFGGHLARRREAALRRRLARGRQLTAHTQRRLRTLFEASGEALVWCGPAGQVKAVNGAAERLLGRDRQALLGRPLPGPGPDGATAEQPVRTELRHPDGRSLRLLLQPLQREGAPAIDRLWRLTDEGAAEQAARAVEQLAHFDSLTGLPNRALFRDKLQQAMARARRHDRPMALMFLDLDRFKLVNDSLGHAAGDALLCHVATTLSRSLRDTDVLGRDPRAESTVSRLGGDEFTVILEDLNHSEDAAMVARRLLDALAAPFLYGEEEIVVSASIGISMYPTDDVDLDGLLRHTDMAMYRSKSLGRNTFCFFSDELDTEVQSRLSLESRLRRAVEQGEFVLHYQPKACLRTGRITGVEALLRWNCPGRGMVAPDRFIPVLEDTGLILPVGGWVIRRALEELEQWDQLGLPPITLAVNLSARQLRQQFLTAMVSDNLQQRGIEPARLELELTESLLMEDTEVTRAMLDGLGRLGVRLAIDDFGTGHSSLSYLRRFRVDTLKIDRSFVSETPGDAEACSVATAIVALGRSLEMRLVAEGVETIGQADFLRDLGASEAQGWLISRPLPLPELVAWFRRYEGERRAGRTPVLPHQAPTDPQALVDLRLDADLDTTA